MKIKKINSDEVLDVTIKEVRLPTFDECWIIDKYSLSYGYNHVLYHAFFKEFIRDEEKFYESCDDEYQPVYGDLMDCGGIYDFIPVIEIEEKLEENMIYVIHGVPFIAYSENKLICLTRTNYYIVGPLIEDFEFDTACEFIDEEIKEIYNWE